jgi:hypothetical protein
MILIITLILGLTIAKPTNYQLKMKNKDEKSFLDNYGDNYDD